MRIKMPAVRIAQADSDTAEHDTANQDILTCGPCKKSFPLTDIVKFIQHKIHHCNKENYDQCYGPGSTGGERDSDDGRPLSLANRRPSISAPITTRKPSGSRVHTPPTTSPPELLDDAVHQSTPKRLSNDDGNATPKRCASASSVSDDERKQNSLDIKQERMDIGSSNDEVSPVLRTTVNESVGNGPKTLADKSNSTEREQNVPHSEPSNFSCSTCKSRFASAWRLVEHVQHAHGVNIYLEGSSNSTNSHQLAGKLKDLSGSSQSSSSSAVSSNPISSAVISSQANQLQQFQQQISPGQVAQSLGPPGLRHHPLLPPPDLHANTFGLLRMPLGPPAVNPALFQRHDFRMEQLVSEQFRLAAVAAANSMTSPNQNFQPDRPHSTGNRSSIPNLPATTQGLGIEPQIDFYSQRLRQLAGTTSPGGSVTGAITNASSPSPRKQQSPPFTSPSPSHLPPTPLTNSSRPQSMTPPEKTTDLAKTTSTTPTSSSVVSCTQTMANNESSATHNCEFCGKKFRFHSNLLVHRRIHTGDKLFKCDLCEFNTSQASKFKRHLKLHKTPDDRTSNAGSLETVDGDDSADELEDEEMGEEEEDEDEMDVNDEDDEAEDLSVSQKDGGLNLKELGQQQASLVGELMDKFGLSNIAQYSEAYKQALQESGNVFKMHLAIKDRDNNNSSTMSPITDKLNGLPTALRLREEFAKNMLQSQQAQTPSQVPLFNPFENPFEASKRMKLDSNDWWGLSGLHRGDPLFENLKKSQMLPNATAGGLLQTNPLMKKDSRRNDTCEYCGKVFKNCSNLTVHRRSHTGEKPYKCELCSYACAQSSKLTRHMKTHGRMGKDVYRCRFCDMPFSVPSTLEKHMRKCVVNQGKAAANGNTMGSLPPNNNHLQLPQMPLMSSDDDNSGVSLVSMKKETTA